MCLAIPAKVIEVKENEKKAVVEQAGVKKEVFNNVVNARLGEYVLVQQGFIVEKLGKEEAEEALKELE